MREEESKTDPEVTLSVNHKVLTNDDSFQAAISSLQQKEANLLAAAFVDEINQKMIQASDGEIKFKTVQFNGDCPPELC